jgi:2-polyprenyl-6-hydroxyphenyl methylase/3-demethylubiquinone-9 3-methyltransferase
MSLKDISSHFAFGENWASYAETIDESRIVEAEQALIRLFGADGLRGKTLIDIGCGSGLHAVATGRLGGTRIVAIDIDPVSVETTRKVLKAHAPHLSAEVETLSVFDLTPEKFGHFDVVYSWGVLHHTGALRQAMANAARLVKPEGVFAFALYHRTRMCGLWRHEKRWYASASPRAQNLARTIYVTLLRFRFLATGRNFRSHVANYKSVRGMNFMHDVHDWMGGFPYESISAVEVDELMRSLGFAQVRSFTSPMTFGLFGSGCDEYVYKRDS